MVTKTLWQWLVAFKTLNNPWQLHDTWKQRSNILESFNLNSVQQKNTCSKSIIVRLEKGVKSVEN